MQVIFLRHGTRNYGIGDIPLNADGLSEAQALSQDSALSQVTHIFCSPKKRAQMTVGPLSQGMKIAIRTVEGLDQQSAEESSQKFRLRVQTALDQIVNLLGEQDTALICSHSDWLTLAAQLIPSSDLDPKSVFFHCAKYRIYRIEDKLWLPQ